MQGLNSPGNVLIQPGDGEDHTVVISLERLFQNWIAILLAFVIYVENEIYYADLSKRSVVVTKKVEAIMGRNVTLFLSQLWVMSLYKVTLFTES